MEHLVSDVKNIKESLHRMGRYIKDKTINGNNTNDIKDLESIGKVVWKFLSMVYDLHWDSLYVDDSKISFRNKVKSKFNPQVPKVPVNSKGKETVKSTYISPLPPSILVKTLKEVNEISKFFKKDKNPQKKSYTQALANLPRSKESLGSKSLATQTLCVCVLCMWLPIMLQLASINLDSSLGRNLNVHVDHILLNQDAIYFMSVVDLMNTRIQEGIP